MTMTASFTKNFGIEIELINLNPTEAARVICEAGIPAQTEIYNHTDHSDEMWKVVTDASIKGAKTCEVVSPILHGEAGLAIAKRVAEALEDAGASANKSCGLHVHFDARSMNCTEIKSIVTRYAAFESRIDKFMPMSRRSNHNYYCASVSKLVSSASFKEAATRESLIRAQGTRYQKVNLQSLGRHNTVEFRQHSGTVNASKIASWVLFLNAFIDESIRLAHETRNESSINLGRKEQKLIDLIREGVTSKEGLANAFNILPHSVATIVFNARKQGMVINTNRAHGTTFYTIGESISAPVNHAEDDLFNGVPSEIVAYCNARAVVLAA